MPFLFVLLSVSSMLMVLNNVPSNDVILLSSVLTFSFGANVANDSYDLASIAILLVSLTFVVVTISSRASFATVVFVTAFAIGIPCCLAATLKLIISAVSDLFVGTAYLVTFAVAASFIGTIIRSSTRYAQSPG